MMKMSKIGYIGAKITEIFTKQKSYLFFRHPIFQTIKQRWYFIYRMWKINVSTIKYFELFPAETCVLGAKATLHHKRDMLETFYKLDRSLLETCYILHTDLFKSYYRYFRHFLGLIRNLLGNS